MVSDTNYIGSTGIIYVEDKVSWAWGFSICVLANVFGLAMFLLGRRYYYEDKSDGSPFTSLARVIVASIRKRKTVASFETKDYYYGDGRVERIGGEAPSKRFRLLNRAAFKTEGDHILPNGSVANPWKICTVIGIPQLEFIIRLTPLWSTSIFLGTPIGIHGSLSVLQALNMDRNLSRHFQVPAGSIMVMPLVFTAVCLSVFDRYICPLWKKMRGKNLTPLQQIGVGHVISFVSMAASALVESKRRDVALHSYQLQGSNIVPLSVLWLVPQLATVGIGEAFHFPGQVALYYQEFPNSLKNMSSAMMAMLIGISFYLSTALIDFLGRVTPWLPDNINDGRLDNVYWVLVVLGSVINFGYYLVCSWFHEYKNIEKEDDI
ncbi:protein NRT1/ PTR FAMILY 2.6-like [Primulina huaijiensis]|uniref:protein NRT1/ PTR FAMILY 2.6-like n=1 Tax=Primulina huaijiensis TaxID=1492673 RepID=UPI003CC7174E